MSPPKKAAPPPPVDTGAELRGKLTRRLSVAAVLVGLLLGILAVFDYLATPPEEEEVNVYTKPVPVAPKKEVSQPVIASSNLPEPPEKPLGTEVAVPPAPPVPETPPAPAPEAKPGEKTESAKTEPAKAESKAGEPKTAAVGSAGESRKSPAAKTENRPLSRSTGGRRSSGEVAQRYVPGTPFDDEPPVIVTPPARQSAATGTPTAPSARVVQVQPAPPAPSPVSRLFSGFLLQAGVFNNVQRAEELHAKLTLSGVPSTVETRVQVGPFKTRQEAEAAQARLRELGIETMLVAPSGARR